MRKRITWLDDMRGFMIIWVVMCHSLVLNQNLGIQGHIDASLLYVINLFIMPCFFAISGFLYHRVRSWQQYKTVWSKKGVGLMVPYLIFSVILHVYMHSPDPWWSIGYQPIFLMWFLYALFFIFIIVSTLDWLRVSPRFQLVAYLIAMLVQTRLHWFDGPDYDMNPISCILGYLIFFYGGFLIKRYYQDFKAVFSRKRVIGSLWMILAVGTCIQAGYTGIFPYNTDGVQLSDFLMKMISVLAFFSLFMTASGLHLDGLNLMGKNTLVVYLVHYLVLHSIFIWIMTDTVIHSPLLQSGLRFVSGVLGSLIVVWLVKHVKFLAFWFYPRKFI